MTVGPLTGLRVLEFGQIAAGPFVGMLLADLGADVVKVERPDGGDGMRSWPPLIPGEDGEYSGNFASLNRNKRSIAIDLKDPDDLRRLLALCSKADVVVENFRPGVLTKLRLGYDDLSALNPGLVYCSLSGYGQHGPYASQGAFDVTIQAASGLMSVTGEDTGGPTKCGVPVGDFTAGLYAAFSILAALRRRSDTGIGAAIDCSMLGSLLGVAALQTSEYFGTGRSPARLGSAHPRNAPYQAYRAEDRFFVVAAGNEVLWQKFCIVVGLPELAADERFTPQVRRAKNQKELEAILAPVFLARTADEWLADLIAEGIPCAPVNDFAAILADPHVASMDLLHELMLPNGVQTKTVGFPVRISGYRFNISRMPPTLGQDTEIIMNEWLPLVMP
ncbi:MAG: carnitine dehydratase [Acidiphilium sp. 37-64-53]|uniref:CaiB/BaiF CoA transferase family protein n=1 Tax=unclassified Acidiphilium TaxID=2617493 RepID=UPI000BC68B40|nr:MULTISPECIES: CoA transferase [unclassified Acidiphilium]OYW00099.1 MAG: carnitine dehydratase [Acidiphilium sp. 37-64-53]OZB24433.1 MAG: carnitine dehydratase [Acidiphilium sp. 34-64-41]HQT89808.1 CoA transferase [Acidiphilium sp.]